MTKPLIDLPSNSASPLCVHINRNGFKESLHQVDVAVCDADGSVILGMGDLESVIFPRSAMKPLQSIALVELSKTLEDRVNEWGNNGALGKYDQCPHKYDRNN